MPKIIKKISANVLTQIADDSVRWLIMSFAATVFGWLNFGWALSFFEIPFRELLTLTYFLIMLLNWWLFRKKFHNVVIAVIPACNVVYLFWAIFLGVSFDPDCYGLYLLLITSTFFFCGLTTKTVYNIRYQKRNTFAEWWFWGHSFSYYSLMLTTVPIAVYNLVLVVITYR